MMVALLAMTRPRPDAAPAPSPVGSGGLIPAATSTARPTVPLTPIPTVVPTATPGPTAPRPPTPAPRATGDPRLVYAEFLLRVNDDRSTVEGLNRALAAAADAQDPDAVRIAAVAILDFVDSERDWLREHPPADCYAKAHGSANDMLEAYGLAADRFVDWAASGGGLAGLAALGEAVDAAQEASDALAAFGRVLEATTCQA
ncbi:MAG: hypothetical protein A2Z32_10110 [Chloroflexi bacterium RBG_16_69_14]|nr:MAG: hypothetical protein A2Z32_10110 [Chloroflexi bacterium RBG_16_69_14]